MPIYAYRCSACGHAQDHLQKMSDDPLHACPACGGETYVKQVTAAGFQLKGSGWYVTDFRGGNSGGPKKDEGSDKPGERADAPSDAKAEGKADAKPDAKPGAKAEAKPDAKPADKPAATAPTKPAAAPPAAG
jgi:putative FmdB family regulatory protein